MSSFFRHGRTQPFHPLKERRTRLACSRAGRASGQLIRAFAAVLGSTDGLIDIGNYACLLRDSSSSAASKLLGVQEELVRLVFDC